VDSDTNKDEPALLPFAAANRRRTGFVIYAPVCGYIIKLNEPAFIQLHKCYAHQLQNEQKSIGTIQAYSRISESFFEYLEMKRYKNISEVKPKDVNEFVLHISNRFPKGLHVVLPVLRSFFRFLESKDKATACLIWAVPSDSRRKTYIVSGVTYDETQKLLETVDRNDSLGKRNYAILLLATRTGLRRTDISNLRLSDIKWKTGTIELVQKKNNSLLVLPLLADVGNAIADYILNARPKVDSPYVFLRSCAPFTKIDGAACYRISSQAMEKAGVHQKEGEQKGIHCLRHAIATRLLEKETPLSVISTILGHKSKDSTKIYLSTDIKNLKFCALGLDGIEVEKEELR